MKKEQILKDNEIIDFNEAKKTLIATATATATATAGGGPDENWLEGLEVGTVFFSRPKVQPGERVDPRDRMSVTPYMIQEKAKMVTNLAMRLPDGKQVDVWVKTLEFSRSMELVEILSIVNPEVKEETDQDKTE